MTLRQAIQRRLSDIRYAFQDSGVSEHTGKLRYHAGTREVAGRVGGVRKMFPELRDLPQSPKTIGAAIRRGKGKVFRQVYTVVERGMLREGFKPSRAGSGRRTVDPHKGKRYCVHCKSPHTKSQHRFHGPGSFQATHLFAFNPPIGNTVTPPAIFLRYLEARGYFQVRADLAAQLYAKWKRDKKAWADYLSWLNGPSLIGGSLFNPKKRRARARRRNPKEWMVPQGWEHEYKRYENQSTVALKKEYLELQRARFNPVFGGNARKAQSIVGHILRERGYYSIDNSPFGEIQIKENPSTSTRTATRTATRTSTSTKAYTSGNVTVTGGAGAGATSVTIRRNPPGVVIYGRVLRIEAQKTQKHRCDPGCKKAGHRYFHDFKPGAVMYGLPDGSLRIKK